MKLASLIVYLLLAATNIAYSQYYFSDIITTQRTNQRYAILKSNHVLQVSAKSYEADGELSEHFVLEQQIAVNGTAIITTADHPSTDRSESVSQYAKDKIIKTTDSTENIKSTTSYAYDNNDMIVVINNMTQDVFMNDASQELHQWRYENAQPVSMLLIKNNADTMIIDLVKDAQGNIVEEHWKKKGRTTEKYFYYYDSNDQLTDIVRYNAKAQRLLPEYLFEYDTNGLLLRSTHVPQGSADYLVWQYVYATNGLKQKELCFNKQKQPVGRIEYTYR